MVLRDIRKLVKLYQHGFGALVHLLPDVASFNLRVLLFNRRALRNQAVAKSSNDLKYNELYSFSSLSSFNLWSNVLSMNLPSACKRACLFFKTRGSFGMRASKPQLYILSLAFKAISATSFFIKLKNFYTDLIIH